MRFEWQEDRAPSTAVVAAVAAVEDVPPTELPPLQYSVAVDGLDALLEHRTDDADVDVRVRFEYAGYTVTVDQDEGIHLDPATPEAIDASRDSGTSSRVTSFDSIDGFERCEPIDECSSPAEADDESSASGADEESGVTDADEDSDITDADEDSDITDADEDSDITDADEESDITDADEDSDASGSSASE